jgi:hypothetical protein
MVTTWYASSFERLQRLTDDSHKSLSLRRMGSYYCHPHVLLCRSPLAWSTPFRAAERGEDSQLPCRPETDGGARRLSVHPPGSFARSPIAKGKRPHTVGTSPTPNQPPRATCDLKITERYALESAHVLHAYVFWPLWVCGTRPHCWLPVLGRSNRRPQPLAF